MAAAAIRPKGTDNASPLAPSLGDRTKKQRGKVEMVFLVLDSRTARKGSRTEVDGGGRAPHRVLIPASCRDFP